VARIEPHSIAIKWRCSATRIVRYVRYVTAGTGCRLSTRAHLSLCFIE
jgi:hypothetical protein